MPRSTQAEHLTEKNIAAIKEMERASHDQRTTGTKLADYFTRSIGSWSFILVQSAILLSWMAFNIEKHQDAWDPYPFILLNLVLSFQAAYASPIIMMSQNRQAKLAEKQSQLDLQINLLSEQENTEMLKLLHSICKKLEIRIEEGSEVEALKEKTSINKLIALVEANSSDN